MVLISSRLLSICVLVKDEYVHLGRMLDELPLRGSWLEVVIVDNGSDEVPQSVIDREGVRVFVERDAEFDRARDRYLSEAVGDWILVVDADEVVRSFELQQFVTFLTTASPVYSGFAIPLIQPAGKGVHSVVHMVRAFRREAVVGYSSSSIHAQVLGDLQRRGCVGSYGRPLIWHFDEYYSDRSSAKRERNIDACSRVLADPTVGRDTVLRMHRFLSQEYLARGDYANAVREGRLALATTSPRTEWAAAIYVLHALLAMHDFEAAEVALREYRPAAGGPHLQINSLRSRLYFETGRWDELKSALEQDLFLYPSLPHPYINMASIVEDSGVRLKYLNAAADIAPWLATEESMFVPRKDSLFASQTLEIGDTLFAQLRLLGAHRAS